jgi:hypothetical protein
VEGSERPAFTARFDRTRYGGWDWPPMASYNDYEQVLLYSTSERRDMTYVIVGFRQPIT